MTVNLDSTPGKGQTDNSAWKQIVVEYQKPSPSRAIWQMVNTLVPYALLWWLMYRFISISWWLIPPLAVLAAAFLVRVFIIFHDCTHGSFFKSRTANEIVGWITGILTFTPFHHWRWEHSVHHASAGNLDRRGIGDVWTLTVKEYLASSFWKRLSYRVARNPIVLFVIAPLGLFVFWQRIPNKDADKRERWSVYLMNVALAGMIAVMGWFIGFKAYLLIQTAVLLFSGTAGVWMFYVQHQFDGVYWERGDEWDFATTALQGSSFYKLPRILQWFSGNIGFHHIHHLSPRIPNYNLERCHKAHPLFQSVKPVTLRTSCKSLTYRLWDEQGRRLIGYRELHEIRSRLNQTA
jgi:omega-6 fatty acid desaturase (delta-12 desaturase)